MMPSSPDARIFRYGISRAGLVMTGLLGGLFAVFWGQYVYFDLATPDSEGLIGLISIMLVLAAILVPVPAMEMIWWARGRVAVDTTGLRWRGWGKWTERGWGEIVAVGMPPADARKQDDERIHVIIEDDYEFIHGFALRDRDGLRELLRSYGGLDETEIVGKHTFFCRPGAGKFARERAQWQVDPDDDAVDFWAGRFRRF